MHIFFRDFYQSCQGRRRINQNTSFVAAIKGVIKASEFFFYLKQGCFQVRRMLFICQKQVQIMAMKTSAFKPKKDALHDPKSKRDTNMENVRIVQKNLVFVSGLPASIADADLLKSDQYFGRYGKVSKVVTNPQQPLKKPCSYQAYVTYSNSTDAAIAITALDGFNFQQKPLKVSFGTTKYCAHFLRGYECLNADCFYLHEFDRKNQVLNKETKSIFEEQNEEAMDIVYANLDQIVARIVETGEEIPEDGFPSLMEMMEFLVQSKDISSSQLQSLLKKHKGLKLPKLVQTFSSPACLKTKPESPKQTLKLTKSNSFSTVGSPSKSQTEIEKNGSYYKQKQKQTTQKSRVQKIENIVIENQQKIEKGVKGQVKAQKKQKIEKQTKQELQQMSTNKRQEQMEANIEKQFLKHILKVNEKSKSKMQFAGQPQWQQMHKIKEIVQKHLIISN